MKQNHKDALDMVLVLTLAFLLGVLVGLPLL